MATQFETVADIREAFIAQKDTLLYGDSISESDFELYNADLDKILKSDYNVTKGVSLIELLDSILIFKDYDEHNKEIVKKEISLIDQWLLNKGVK